MSTVVSALSPLLAQQKVTIQITRESEDGKSVFDTSFIKAPDFDLEAWLDQTQLKRTSPGESVSTTIIISDEEDQKAQADIYRPQEETREAGVMGVYLNQDRHATRGVPIQSLVSGGAAQRAGLLSRDTIVSIDGQSIRNFDDFVKAKKGKYAGDTLDIEYRRGGTLQSISLVLAGRKPMQVEAEQVRTHSPKAHLGVYPTDLTPALARSLRLENLQGVYLQGVVKGSAADLAGLQSKDVIIRMNDREIQAAWELSEVLRALSPGDSLRIGYIRSGEENSTVAKLTARSSPTPQVVQRPEQMLIEEGRAFLGVTLRTNTQAPGVPIASVERNSAADRAGLRQGDVIMKIDGKRTIDYNTLSTVMRTLSPDQKVTISYLRDERRKKTKAILGYKATKVWVRVDPEQRLDPESIIEEVRIRDQKEGDQLAQNMESPNLKMDFFEFYPNPNQGAFTINFDLPTRGETIIRLYGANGQIVFSKNLLDFSGAYREVIDLRNDVSPGLYLIQVTQGSKGMVKRMIVRQ